MILYFVHTAGGLWALVTSFSVSSLRSELSSLSFLFRPQSGSLAITKAAVDQGLRDLDAALAAVFLGIKVGMRHTRHKSHLILLPRIAKI